MNINSNACKPCGCTHTRHFSKQWSKGGSREQRNLAILPRDLK